MNRRFILDDIHEFSANFLQVILCGVENGTYPRHQATYVPKGHITMYNNAVQFPNIMCTKGPNRAPKAFRAG